MYPVLRARQFTAEPSEPRFARGTPPPRAPVRGGARTVEDRCDDASGCQTNCPEVSMTNATGKIVAIYCCCPYWFRSTGLARSAHGQEVGTSMRLQVERGSPRPRCGATARSVPRPASAGAACLCNAAHPAVCWLRQPARSRTTRRSRRDVSSRTHRRRESARSRRTGASARGRRIVSGAPTA